MITLLVALIIFHLGIFLGFIPYEKVWAGRLNSVAEMKTFESFSILINAFMLFIILKKHQLLQKNKNNKIIDIFLWVFVVFFGLNSIGNLFAKSLTELILGTTLTVCATFLCFIIVKPNSKVIKS